MPREFIPGRREPDVPSSTFTYFFREALRRIWVSRSTSFAAIAMIAISLLIVGAFLLVAESLGRAAETWRGSARVTVYMKPGAPPEAVREVDRWLAARPELSRRRFVSQEEALARFRGWFAELSDVVGEAEENPFPASFEIEVDPRAGESRQFHQSMSALRRIDGVDQVQYDWEWIARLERLVGVINMIGLAAGGILAIAAAFTIANVIRLTMILYREEVEIMRLVGATERIIRGPFVIEGILQGTIGGLLAVALLFGAYEAARRSLDPSASMLWGFLFSGFLSWQKSAALVAGGTIAGWLGSWLSVRQQQQV